jgi:hypothetical protein
VDHAWCLAGQQRWDAEAAEANFVSVNLRYSTTTRKRLQSSVVAGALAWLEY